MTPKERVQKKYPKSFAFKYRFNEPNHRWRVYGVNLIAYGPTAAAAWAVASQGIKK